MLIKEKTYYIKGILLGFTILLLFLPAIQHKTGWWEVRELKGAIEKVEPVPFSMTDWFSGAYAKGTDQYFTNNMGFRPKFVRMDNQLAFSLFGEIRVQNTVVGKEDYLFEKNYIDAYTGKDFLGEAVIKEKVRKLKSIQDSLAMLDKHLLIILAVGKASFYPEYIPDDMMLETDSTNYLFYKKELKEQGVNCLDFMEWFLENKGKMPYPLYPKTGIHWSEYGMTLASDSLIQRVEGFNDQWDLPELYWDEIEYVDERRETDNDIELALNLMEPFPNHKMAYPKIQYNTEGKDSINAIMISDSFFWRMFSSGVMPKAFAEGQFWYYNYQSFPRQFKVETKVEELDLKEQIDQVDVIMMMATEGNLHRFPWEAEKELFNYFKGGYVYNKAFLEKQIKRMEETIRSNKGWLKSVEEKAELFGISLDSMLRKDAIYMLEQAEK